jgi:hypothetical protein
MDKMKFNQHDLYHYLKYSVAALNDTNKFIFRHPASPGQGTQINICPTLWAYSVCRLIWIFTVYVLKPSIDGISILNSNLSYMMYEMLINFWMPFVALGLPWVMSMDSTRLSFHSMSRLSSFLSVKITDIVATFHILSAIIAIQSFFKMQSRIFFWSGFKERKWN